jgi:hypothetical protein
MYYAVEDNTTGFPEYDAMFDDVRAAIPRNWDSVMQPGDTKLPHESFGSVLWKVARVYEKHYPEARKRDDPAIAALIDA